MGKTSSSDSSDQNRLWLGEAVLDRLLLLSRVVERSPSIVVISDPRGAIQYVNPRFTEVTGFSPEEALGSPVDSLGLQGAEESRSMWEMLASGMEWRGQFLNKRKNGELYWESALLWPVKDDRGVTAHVLKVAEDITERKSAEEARARGNRLLKTLSQAQLKFIARADPVEIFEGLLSAVLALTDSEYGFIGEILASEEGGPYLKTRAVTNIAWNDETRAFYDRHAREGLEFKNLETLFGRVITSGEPLVSNDPSNDQRRGGLPKGHPPLRAFAGLPVIADGELVGMVGLANRAGGYDRELVDFLEPYLLTCGSILEALRRDKRRKQAEKALLESETRLRAIIENVIDGILTIDQGGVIQIFNPAAERIFGYASSEAVGRNVNILIPEPHRSRHDGYIRDFVERGHSEIIGLSREVRGRRKDGTDFPMELSVGAMTLPNYRSFIAIVRDISERKRWEWELIQTREAAERAARAKSDFLAVMSHEIRTPMNAIIGMADLALDSDLNADQTDCLTTLKSSADDLLTLIDEILDFSKIEAGKVEIELRPFALREKLYEAVNTFSAKAGEKGLSLIGKTAPDLPKWLLGDWGRMRQVIHNLVGNAVKFTAAGKVVVTADKEEVSGDTVTVRFTVQDTGIGIPHDKTASIFERFVQADASTSRQYGGTGLGLAICRRLAQAMGGRIWVESELGRGSSFCFSLPLRTAEAPSGSMIPQRPLQLAPPAAPLRILLAEDNPVNRKLALKMLGKAGHIVTTAVDGAEAVKLWEDNSFDVILMDVQMPLMDGYAATREIRRREQGSGKHIPIVAMTAQAMKGDDKACLEAGMDAYLSKPVKPGALLDMLASVLS